MMLKINTKFIIIFILLLISVSGLIAQQAPVMNFPNSIQAPTAPTLREMASERQRQTDRQAAAMMAAASERSAAKYESILAEEGAYRPASANVSYEFPEADRPEKRFYRSAKKEIDSMLEGKQPLSLKRAVFIAENAFLENTMRYDLFCANMETEADVVRAFMKKEGFAANNETAKKYFLQRLMADALTLRDREGKPQFTHTPYRYDFNDPFGEKDWTKTFVTKLAAQKTGQCRSLPLFYLILAEQLNAQAWLAYSPQHSYIKLQDGQKNWYNYETTNGNYTSDAWVVSSGFIKAAALQSRIYMDTFSKSQTVASCLVDLARGYVRKFGYDSFVLTCLDKALAYSPRNIFALQMRSDYYAYLFNYVVKQLHYPPKAELPSYPRANDLLQKCLGFNREINALGYEDMPKEIYQAWLKSYESAKGKQPVRAVRP